MTKEVGWRGTGMAVPVGRVRGGELASNADIERENAERKRRHAELEACMQGLTLEKFHGLPNQELVRCHDVLMDPQQHLGFLGPEDYLNELRRRETERQSQRLEYLTWALTALTVVIAVATLALLFHGG